MIQFTSRRFLLFRCLVEVTGMLAIQLESFLSLLFSTEGKERDKKRAKQRERVAVDCVCLRQMKA